MFEANDKITFYNKSDSNSSSIYGELLESVEL